MSESSQQLRGDELEVEVEAYCLQPNDLRRAGNVPPGGGLVGRVVATGEAATGLQDKRVMVPPLMACGECDTCRRGLASVCPKRVRLGQDSPGPSAGTVRANARWITEIDDSYSLAPKEAAFAAGPALLAYAMFCKAGVSAGDPMLVVGRGPEASFLRQLGKARGVKVAAARGTDTSEQIQERLQEAGITPQPLKILVCDGDAQLSRSLDVAWPGSIIVTVQELGIVEAQRLAENEITLLAMRLAHPDLLAECAALISKGEVAAEDYIRGGLLEESLSTDSKDTSRSAFESGECLVLQAR